MDDDLHRRPHRRVRRRRVVPAIRTSLALRATVAYAAAACLWAALWWVAASGQLADLPSLPSAWGATAAGATFVAATAPLVWWWQRRWQDRLSAAHRLEQRALQDIQDVARARTVFLTSVSHELRTPLTTILGGAQTIRAHQERLGTERVAVIASRLEANAHRLEQVVVDLLALLAPAGDLTARCGQVDLEALLREEVRRHDDGRHRLTVDAAVPCAVLDEAKVRRIVGELVRNVVRHTPESTAAWVSSWAVRDTLHLTVADDGPGVDEAILDAATEPFVQGPHVDSLPSPGLGLGLALAARYAEVHGGTMTIDRPPGGGTRVDVAIPLRTTVRPRIPEAAVPG